ncbi:sterol desaturase family protein [Phenylobacterium sp.]|jgi:sterol desaturase/sphingolipid hydroxylase (fatty acid hydroxylase superfamily)|uniref:sterol desaturase family protein n=1 Tax=Phenylobacterium sp. TaxID=1871053 RepID=UPI002F430031
MFLNLLTLGVLSLLEGRFPARRDPGQRPLNMAIWLVNFASASAAPLVMGAVVAFSRRTGLPAFPVDAWPPVLAAAAYIVAMDLGECLFHRAQHAIPVLWRMHSLHHSDPCMNASTTVRHFWGDVLIKALTIWPVAAIAFRPTPSTLAVYVLISLYHYFSHANLAVNYGRWSWVLNSPAYHRIHHSREPQHYGVNFAGLFPIFDVILGSYQVPDVTPQTGLDETPRGLFQALAWPARSTPGRSAAQGVGAALKAPS